MTRRRQTKFEEVKPDMAPMIDVTFLLLIFFIVTLKFKVLEGRLDAALPKDMGSMSTETDPIEKVDIVIRVKKPGVLSPDPTTRTHSQPQGRLKHYVGRQVEYLVGTNKFRDVGKLSNFLDRFAKTQEMKDDTPITLDVRKGSVYGDVVVILDVVIEKGFQKISFAGSFEE
ncbi:MAG: biopolymer transporter ExbD [Planctomycetota bacterium]|jgi:biopolymer transport protein ExbD|nr:biopolymer transporter ExbD [Planctomycetota bacterium]MDP6942188.1 biopolymer transporter ExbD [Planctomycetota bacterium]